MKKSVLLLAVLLLFSLTACSGGGGAPTPSGAVTDGQQGEPAQPETLRQSGTADGADANILVVYFSATGNTAGVAEQVARAAGADLVELIPAQPYTDADLNYSDDSCRANREQNDAHARPEISGQIENMDAYDVVLIGHPIWWGQEPRILDTFMESYDFSGKTLANFCTSGGSGIRTSTENLRALSPDANWLEGRRFDSGASLEEAQEWLHDIGIITAAA